MRRDDGRMSNQSLKFSVTPDYFRMAARPSRSGMRFSELEIRQILISVGVLTFAFAIALSGGIYNPAGFSDFGITFIAAFFGVVSAFLFHELSHKRLAQRYGCFAEFRMSNQGLFIGLLTSLFGIVFALPGAVVISGFISQRQNGMISLAGPVTNMIFGAICLPFIFLMELSDELSNGIYIVGFINLWLAVLNLLPIRPLDGSKLLRWNLKIYIGVFATALILLSTIFIYRIFF